MDALSPRSSRSRYDAATGPDALSPLRRSMNSSKAERLRRRSRPAASPAADESSDSVDSAPRDAMRDSVDSAPPAYDEGVADSADLDARAADLLSRCDALLARRPPAAARPHAWSNVSRPLSCDALRACSALPASV